MWNNKPHSHIIHLNNTICLLPATACECIHPRSTQTLLVPIQNRCLPDAEGTTGVRPLTPGVPQALPGLASHEHRGDVVDLISRLSASALLGLRDATAFTPAPAGVEDQDQAQDGQQKGDHSALRGGEWYLEQTQNKEERRKKSRERVKGENRFRESCQVEYRSKSKQ